MHSSAFHSKQPWFLVTSQPFGRYKIPELFPSEVSFTVSSFMDFHAFNNVSGVTKAPTMLGKAICGGKNQFWQQQEQQWQQ